MDIKRFDLPLRASTKSVKQVADAADAEYTLIYTRQTEL